eukprot:m.140766 g.140766  ORF g.140766 m.140766 type:complete len:461 (-) comp16115_c0_seq4:1048-2430(-)
MPPAKRHSRGRYGGNRSKRPKRRPPKRNASCKESLPAEWLHDWELSDNDGADARRNASDASTSEMLESVSELMRGVDFATPQMAVPDFQSTPPETALRPRKGLLPFIRETSSSTLPDANSNWPVPSGRPRDSAAWARELRRLGNLAQTCSRTLTSAAATPVHQATLPQGMQDQLRDCADELESVVHILRSMSGGVASPWRTRDKSATALKAHRNGAVESGESGGEADESGCETDVAPHTTASPLLMEHTSAIYCNGIICRDKESLLAVQDEMVSTTTAPHQPFAEFLVVWDSLLEFVQEPFLKSLRFPPLGRDDRRRIHALAKTFGLHSHSRGTGSLKAPVLSKTASTGIPPDAALGICEQHWALNGLSSSTSSSTHHLAQHTSASSMASSSTAGHHGADSPMKDVVGRGEPPLQASNVGHQMLVSMGWQPGRGLGERGLGLSQPVSAVIRPRRAGLGAE